MSAIIADVSPSSSSQPEEECLRPSLIRRKFQPFYTINVQCSPLQSIQALTSPAPSPSTRPAHSCFSPNAETDLFGSPAPSARTPMSRHQCYVKQRTAVQSPSLQQLQNQHTALLKDLADYKAYQDSMEAHLQDKTFLLEHLKQLQPGNAASCLPEGLLKIRQADMHTQTESLPDSSQTHMQHQASPAKSKELWQQLSFASSDDDIDSQRLEDLQAELADCKQQLALKETASAKLHTQLCNIQSQLQFSAQKVSVLEHSKAETAWTAAMTESSLSEQLEAVRQQHQQSLDALQQQHQYALQALHSTHAQTEAASQSQIWGAHDNNQQLAKTLQAADHQHQDAMQELQTRSAKTESDLLDQLQHAQQDNQELTALCVRVQSLEEESKHMSDMAAVTESALMDDLELAKQQHQEAAKQLQNALAEAQASLSQQMRIAEAATQEVDGLRAQLLQAERDKVQLAQSAEQASALMRQMQLLQQQHQRTVESLSSRHAETESALRRQLSQVQQQCQQLADQLSSNQSAVGPLHKPEDPSALSLSSDTVKASLINDLAAAQQQLIRVTTYTLGHQAACAPANVAAGEAIGDQLAKAQQDLITVTAQLRVSQAAQSDLASSLAVLQSATPPEAGLRILTQAQQESTAQLAAAPPAQVASGKQLRGMSQADTELRDSYTRMESALKAELAKAQQALAMVTAQLTHSQAAQADLATELQQPNQANAAVTDVHTPTDAHLREELAQAQRELTTISAQLTASQAAHALLARDLEQASQANAELADSHTLTEGTLLERLQEAQAEQQRLEFRAQHLEDRHSEINRQLIFARSSQAKAGCTEAELTQQLTQARQHADKLQHLLQQQEAEASSVTALHAGQDDAEHKLSMAVVHSSALQQQLQQSEAQAASQQQVLVQTELKLRKYKACYRDVKKQLDTANTQAAALSQEELQSRDALQQQLGEVQSQLNEQLVKASAHEQEQLAAQADLDQNKQQVKELQMQMQTLKAQLADSETQLCSGKTEVDDASQRLVAAQHELTLTRQQITQSQDKVRHISLELDTAQGSTSERQQQLAKQVSENSALQTRLDEALQQVKNSELQQEQHVQELQHLQHRQHEQCRLVHDLQMELQQTAEQLQNEQQRHAQLNSELAVAQHAHQAAAVDLQDLHNANCELEGKAAEGSLLIQELRVHLAAAQAHMVSQQTRLQAHERDSEALVGDLQQASCSLAHVLHQQDTSLPNSSPSGSSLQEVAEQVCGLAEGLLLYHAMLQTLPVPPSGSSKMEQPRSMPKLISKHEDSLSSHVAAAQARANHIVQEFESMLLVTGGHSQREILAIQSHAGLGEAEPVKAVHNVSRGQALPGRQCSTPGRGETVQRTKRDCACGPSSSSNSDSRLHAMSSASRTSLKSSGSKSKLKALKENRAPSLTYVSGGQVRGARRAHEVAGMHPLKPSLKGNFSAAAQAYQPTVIHAQLAYTSKLRKTTQN